MKYKDEVREYPDDFAAELMATSKRQRFETEPSDPADMTVNQLRQVLKDLDVEVPANAKKIELVNLVRATAGVFAKS